LKQGLDIETDLGILNPSPTTKSVLPPSLQIPTPKTMVVDLSEQDIVRYNNLILLAGIDHKQEVTVEDGPQQNRKRLHFLLQAYQICNKDPTLQANILALARGSGWWFT